MAKVGKENQQERPLPLPSTPAEPGRKTSFLLAASARSSKIPVLSKTRLPPELRQSQQQTCFSKESKTCKISHSSPAPGEAILELAAGLSPKSLSREPLVEMQLTASGHRNEGDSSHRKERDKAEFVPDPEALASILSNTGLTNQMVSAARKPSLARRVPLKGKRACTAQSSLCSKAPGTNSFCVSHTTKSASKAETDPSRSCSLSLNTQQLNTLSTALRNLTPGKTAKPGQLTDILDGDQRKGSASSMEAESLRSLAGGGKWMESNSVRKKKTTGTSLKEDEFIPDPAAKVSILLNIGLSHSALGANGKVSLAQQFPGWPARKPSFFCSSTQGEGAPVSALSAGKFGRVSCRTTRGLKGLEKSEVFGAQRVPTPHDRCSTVECSPYGLARRVPIRSPQSLPRRVPVPVTSCRKDERVKWLAKITRKMGTTGSKTEGTTVPWEKIAVRLFDDEMAASVKKAPVVPVMTTEMGKLQRIELLAQLFQQEMDGHIDYKKVPSLEELHRRLTTHCSPTLEASKPDLSSAPLQDPKPDSGEQAPALTVSVTSAPSTLLSTSSRLHVCCNPSQQEVRSPSSTAKSTGLAKKRLDHLLAAPLRFREACLNDECAFYTSRITSLAQSLVQRCQEPVAKTLNAQDAMHFIPISASVPLSPSSEAENTHTGNGAMPLFLDDEHEINAPLSI